MPILDFDTNSVGLADNNIFGLPSNMDNSKLILIPVPWEVTVSYRNGTAKGPEKILEASYQIDLFDIDSPDMWKEGFYLLDFNKDIIKKNDYLRHCAELIISNLSEGGSTKENIQLQKKLDEINQGCQQLNEWVYQQAKELLNKGKMVALIGGDHSTPLGLMKAIGEHYNDFGLLQIDAHADLRQAYEGFTYSHASIMYNVLNEVPQMKKLVQVGVRDFCDEEYYMIQNNPNRIKTFFDNSIKKRMYNGDTWNQVCNDIINELPQNVYISFDIDGLDPKLCKNTGTPVQGGFEADEILYLFQKIHDSGRKILGFDLNEVSCGEDSTDAIDASVGARTLYRMCNLFMKSNLNA
ncbi:MAG TPA: agmatinase family protein [Chitinophagaceae bacterium]|nr:MAG: arginase/agmatinase/formiminoglutamase [Bacteroidetes bacterium OLB11]HMN32171.1 agmatinase family protein [Chitinophagaceae bacterium]